ncbi:aldo/keto reductase, partial [Wenyingzhuangia sp. 1_MG-2023]|nr:aldo/keto reductase [Wenyingzhuangia sp. 1_MG-2023]
SLAWVCAQGDHIVPIPGTRSVAHMQENLQAATVSLSADVIHELNQLINQQTVSGRRYNLAQQVEVDTEEFAE